MSLVLNIYKMADRMKSAPAKEMSLQEVMESSKYPQVIHDAIEGTGNLVYWACTPLRNFRDRVANWAIGKGFCLDEDTN